MRRWDSHHTTEGRHTITATQKNHKNLLSTKNKREPNINLLSKKEREYHLMDLPEDGLWFYEEEKKKKVEERKKWPLYSFSGK